MTDEVGESNVGESDARIAELEAEVEVLRRERDQAKGRLAELVGQIRDVTDSCASRLS